MYIYNILFKDHSSDVETVFELIEYHKTCGVGYTNIDLI